jgi:putative heme-binding domain-containing protein
MTFSSVRTFALALLVTALPASLALADGVVTLKEGDRVVLIGNALAEREQYFGHFEAQVHATHPGLNVSMRNQGFTADEVRFRPRSLDFGEPDKHLTLARADVILAFFGFSESFDGEAGLATFEQELKDFIDHTRQQNYSGKGAPRLVLLSPIAHENIGDPNLPDGSATNPNLELYTKAMARVAADTNTPFVDLFKLSRDLYNSSDKPRKLTTNGIHLSDYGYKVFAPALCNSLFGRSAKYDAISPELMAEIAEKDFQYFHRYRAVNGFYIYGGRSQRDNGNPPFTDNYVLENERTKLDEMCEIVDRRIWAAAQGNPPTAPVDYSSTRTLYDVPTNFKEPITILPPEEAVKKFTVAEGYEINLFASEIDFPDLKNPVNFTWDAKGRLWVATMPSYPQYQPPHKPNDKLLIFEDTDGDGKADKQTVFADGLHLPTGFEVGDGGAYVAQEPNLVHLVDTNGDDKADEKHIIFGGFDSGDSHHAIGAFVWGPGGGIYMHEGTFHITQVETPYGVIRNGHGAVYRVDPTRKKAETFVSYNFANPWGHCWDKWGQNFVADASGGANYFGTAFSLRTKNFEGEDDFGPFKFTYRKQMEQFFPKRVRPTAGCELVSSAHFPPEAQGNYLLNNCIGFQGVLQHTVKEQGSGFVGEEIEPILFSSDRNFRPTDLQFGPDGALYIVDWFNPLIGHMQHNLRDPNRDHSHGRIWRITYPSRPLQKVEDLTKLPLDELVTRLAAEEDRVRHRTRIQLREFPAKDVEAALAKWLGQFEKTNASFEHHLLESLWVKQHHNIVDRPLLKALLRSSEPRARAAATRVLSHWRDLLPEEEVIPLLRAQANDEHPRVRLEAVRACSWVNTAAAAEVALEVVKYERDYYIDYALSETIRGAESLWKSAINSGQPFAANNPAGIDYILGSIPTADLVKLPKSAPVYLAMLTRPAVREQQRLEALGGLAKAKDSNELAELTGAIEYVDRNDIAGANQTIYDLVLMLSRREPTELVKARLTFENWTKSAKRAITRRIGFVALVAADQKVDPAWQLATQSITSLKDFLDAIQIIPDADFRASLYSRVEPLLHGLTGDLAKAAEKAKSIEGRYVRIALPGNRRTLTLAEVEVFSKGQNVARRGKARQSNVAFGGVAARAIDGNKSGRFSDNGQTHTTGQGRDVFWEVDLKEEFPIEAITVWNRSEENGKYIDRLEGYWLTVLDADREVVYSRKGNKAPAESARFDLGGNPEEQIRRAAINAITYIPGHDTESFLTLAGFAEKGDQRIASVRSLQRIPRYRWPEKPEAVRPLVKSLLAYAKGVEIAERTSLAVRTSLQLANDLSSLLPKNEGAKLKAEIGELGVRIVTIRTVPHRMRYDRIEIAVQAGKPVEIVLENTDIMPHNLLVTSPGKMMDVAMAAERMATSPDAFAKGFIPDSKDILHSTKLLQAGETERMVIVAPSEPGDYPYVCTFPGHWRTMSGVMHVVNDVDAYLTENPIAEPAEIAEVRPFVRDWKFAEIEGELKSLKGASFAKGKQLFTSIACFNCHQMNGVGGRVGPDLGKMEAKKDLAHIVRSLTEPSKEIDKKYQAWIVVTDEGKQFVGMAVGEDDKTFTLMPNPLGIENCEPIVILKSEIDIRQASPISLMPEKLLNTMTIEEIRDLLAYLQSRGNPDHGVFK